MNFIYNKAQFSDETTERVSNFSDAIFKRRVAENLRNDSVYNLFINETTEEIKECIKYGFIKPENIGNIQLRQEITIQKKIIQEIEKENTYAPTQIERRSEQLADKIFKDIDFICESALINGDKKSFRFGDTNIDITIPSDGLPLFSSEHPYGNAFGGELIGKQSNFFYTDWHITITRSCTEWYALELLKKCNKRLMDIKDENGVAMGFPADTIIIPNKRSFLTSEIKKVTDYYNVMCRNENDLLLNVVTLPHWCPSDDRFMIMSAFGNRCLYGNIVNSNMVCSRWVDEHTGNYLKNVRGRCGVGFGTYKHIMLVVDSTNKVDGASLL